jgi:pantetheine-phosphate adenylyltransferase
MKKIAIYPGSFNPFTIGHLNILEKAEALFGKENVIIAIGENPAKDRNPRDTAREKLLTLRQNMPSKKIEQYSGFLTDFVWEKEKAGADVTVIRGLRNGDDLNYEVNQLRFMEEMKPNMKIIFLVCDKQFEHVSSSAYRALEAVRPFSGHRYLAKELPSTKVAGDTICGIKVNRQATDMLEKYIIAPKKSLIDDSEFTGTYVECLTWIKEQESKNL